MRPGGGSDERRRSEASRRGKPRRLRRGRPKALARGLRGVARGGGPGQPGGVGHRPRAFADRLARGPGRPRGRRGRPRSGGLAPGHHRLPPAGIRLAIESGGPLGPLARRGRDGPARSRPRSGRDCPGPSPGPAEGALAGGRVVPPGGRSLSLRQRGWTGSDPARRADRVGQVDGLAAPARDLAPGTRCPGLRRTGAARPRRPARPRRGRLRRGRTGLPEAPGHVHPRPLGGR